ncbi:DUF6129 family protein [Azoarcus olearius]|uniref:DUF6129 domain-containing protein n=1 Tax=Azoarcus sp. (strain BH72) TaxID=418699 RepID=Q9F0V4_AZOSB|nr:DUF6129 family protein [Azoarcus olearius]AAG35591.1 unknown [Azoarcus olearius]ANQ83630.1 hypothetical protein dqs_0554 [Azoarcus olearius]CAL93161.1 hypothetical protein azo0544 [Azoarcus olearius]
MINDELLGTVAGLVKEQGASEQLVSALRVRWPNLRFTYCSDDDMPPRLSPALAGEGFNLYLIANGDHCLALTKDPAVAIGVVVAEVMADE